MTKEIDCMQISSERIIASLVEVFPECSEMKVEMETQLGELPEWDSMAAVNLQAILQQHFEVEVPLELLGDQTKVEEVLAFLQNPVASEALY
jgi:acyl carrier protein